MNQSTMRDGDDSPNAETPFHSADQLPPIQPPSAGFILQLFVVPAVIVTVILSVWMLLSWVASPTVASTQDLVAGLKTSGPARWQRAHRLADMLRRPQGTELKKSHELAAQLAAALQEELVAAQQSAVATNQVAGQVEAGELTAAAKLRYFLCRTLGEFYVADGLDTLLAAARTDPVLTVRRAALQGTSVLIDNLARVDSGSLTASPQLERQLLASSADASPLIRSETAFVLGVYAASVDDDEHVVTRLDELRHDEHPDTRYNASTALARCGSLSAIDGLVEMLDWRVSESVDQEISPAARIAKRAQIMMNALRATKKLAEEYALEEIGPVVEAIERLSSIDARQREQASVHPNLVKAAQATLAELTATARTP